MHNTLWRREILNSVYKKAEQTNRRRRQVLRFIYTIIPNVFCALGVAIMGEKKQIKRRKYNWFSYGQRKSNEFTPFKSARLDNSSWIERFHFDFITRHRVLYHKFTLVTVLQSPRLLITTTAASDWSKCDTIRTDDIVILLCTHTHTDISFECTSSRCFDGW